MPGPEVLTHQAARTVLEGWAGCGTHALWLLMGSMGQRRTSRTERAGGDLLEHSARTQLVPSSPSPEPPSPRQPSRLLSLLGHAPDEAPRLLSPPQSSSGPDDASKVGVVRSCAPSLHPPKQANQGPSTGMVSTGPANTPRLRVHRRTGLGAIPCATPTGFDRNRVSRLRSGSAPGRQQTGGFRVGGTREGAVCFQERNNPL